MKSRGMKSPGDLISTPGYALAFRTLEPAATAPRRLLVLLHGVGGHTRIKEHPIKIAQGNYTAVVGVMEGTFSAPMPTPDGKTSRPPTSHSSSTWSPSAAGKMA